MFTLERRAGKARRQDLDVTMKYSNPGIFCKIMGSRIVPDATGQEQKHSMLAYPLVNA